MKSSSELYRGSIKEGMSPKGYVLWELYDVNTNKVVKSGHSNVIVNKARETLASAMIGTAVTFPGFIAVGTGTNTPAASDTGLQTLSQYNGANNAKAVDSKTIRSIYTARFIGQFLTTEANITIRELGLFDTAIATNLWARVAVNITKTSSQRLTIYWYITFERSTNVAIKSGASIGATGTLTANTASTATFASAVTVLIVHNNHATEKMYFKINEALENVANPNNADFILAAGEKFELLNEEISVTTISVVKPTTVTLSHTDVSIRGW